MIRSVNFIPFRHLLNLHEQPTLPVALPPCLRVIFSISALSCFSAVCSGTVTVEVAPKVEVLKGETASLPCTYTVSPPSSNTIVEWFIVSRFSHTEVHFPVVLSV